MAKAKFTEINNKSSYWHVDQNSHKELDEYNMIEEKDIIHVIEFNSNKSINGPSGSIYNIFIINSTIIICTRLNDWNKFANLSVTLIKETKKIDDDYKPCIQELLIKTYPELKNNVLLVNMPKIIETMKCIYRYLSINDNYFRCFMINEIRKNMKNNIDSNYFKVLDIDITTKFTVRQIKEKYKNLAKIYHPDKKMKNHELIKNFLLLKEVDNTDEKFEELFPILDDAYKTLSNKKLYKEYIFSERRKYIKDIFKYTKILNKYIQDLNNNYYEVSKYEDDSWYNSYLVRPILIDKIPLRSYDHKYLLFLGLESLCVSDISNLHSKLNTFHNEISNILNKPRSWCGTKRRF